MIVIDFTAVSLSIILLIVSLKRLNKAFSCRLFYYWFFWLIFVLPILLDYLIGYPSYEYYGHRMWGFIQSYNDAETRILYAFFVIFIQLVILYHKPIIRIKRKNSNTDIDTYVYNQDINKFVLPKKMEIILVIVSIIAPILCILLKKPQVIFQFGWREAGKFTEITKRGFFSIIEEWSYLGVLSSLILLMFDRKKKTAYNRFLKLLALLLLYFNLSIESKRSIIMFFLIMAVYIFLLKNKKKNMFQMVFTLMIFTSVALAISLYVKVVSRGYVGFDALYTTTRIDVFRDDTVKLVLYSLFNEKKIKVLSYPFESYIMQIGYLLFISLLSAVSSINIKRRGYDFYITAAVMGTGTFTDKWMTSSMYDEAIANFGLLGIIIIGLFLSYYLKYIDRLPKFESILWLSFLILYTMYSLDYIIIFGEVMIFIHLFMRVRFISGSYNKS